VTPKITVPTSTNAAAIPVGTSSHHHARSVKAMARVASRTIARAIQLSRCMFFSFLVRKTNTMQQAMNGGPQRKYSILLKVSGFQRKRMRKYSAAAVLLAAVMSSPAYGAIAAADTPVCADGNSTNLVLTPPGGAASAGEVIYIAGNYVAGGADSFPSAYSVGGGFTFVNIDMEGLSFGQSFLLRRVAGASEPTSYTITWTGGSFYNIGGCLVVLSGVDNDTPDGTPVSADDAVSDLSFAIPALTTTVNNSTDLVVVAGSGNNTPVADACDTWGNSFVEIDEQWADFVHVCFAAVTRASAGAQGATTVALGGGGQTSTAIRVEVFEDDGGGGGGSAVSVISSVNLSD
jgi:hypothetical protein